VGRAVTAFAATNVTAARQSRQPFGGWGASAFHAARQLGNRFVSFMRACAHARKIKARALEGGPYFLLLLLHCCSAAVPAAVFVFLSFRLHCQSEALSWPICFLLLPFCLFVSLSALRFGFVFTILSFVILSFCQGRFFTGNQLSRLEKKQRRRKKKKTKNEK